MNTTYSKYTIDRIMLPYDEIKQYLADNSDSYIMKVY